MIVLPHVTGDVFLASQHRQLLKVVPVKDGHSVEFAWQVRGSPTNLTSIQE